MAALLLATGSTTLWIATREHVSPSLQLLLLVPALVGWIWTFDRAIRRLSVPRRAVLMASGLVLLTSVATPPSGSQDVWAYVMYGRLVAVHHVSPYRVSPSEVPQDPLLRRMASGWQDTHSVYGPVFTGISAAGAVVSGDSPRRNRLFHQGLAALTVLGLLLVLRRRSDDVASIVLLGLSPPVAAVVNTGHNDLLVGALVLGGVLALARRRPVLAGLVVALAALVKVVAVLPALALGVWAWRWCGRRAAISFGAAFGSVTIAAYATVGGMTAIHPLLEADHVISRGSTWSSPMRDVTRLFRHWDGDASVPEVRQVLYALAPVMLMLVLVLSLWLTRRASPVTAATAASLSFLVVWPYVLPWYAMWALVTAAADPRRWPARAAIALSSALGLAYVDPPGSTPSTHVLSLLSRGAPVVALLVWALLGVRSRGGDTVLSR